MRTLPKLLCAITLLSMSGLVWASCPEGYEENDRTGECVKDRTSSSKKKSTTRKGKWHPYGGTCEDLTSREAISLASNVISGGRFRLNKGASVCKHNVELIEIDNEKVLKITTGLGDGIHDYAWSDIKQGNRRRFEFMFDRIIQSNTAFRLSYSIRVTRDNTFLRVPENHYYWYWVTQLKSDSGDAPIMVVSVDRFNGISAFDYLIQDSSEFGAVKTEYTPEIVGKWVKIAIEFKPSHKNGFRRLWVNDQLVLEENNVQTIYDSATDNDYNLKFGIYQGTHHESSKNPSSIRNDDQQSVQFKDLYFRRI